MPLECEACNIYYVMYSGSYPEKTEKRGGKIEGFFGESFQFCRYIEQEILVLSRVTYGPTGFWKVSPDSWINDLMNSSFSTSYLLYNSLGVRIDAIGILI